MGAGYGTLTAKSMGHWYIKAFSKLRKNRLPALELLLANNGQTLLLHPFENYCAGTLEVVKEMLEDPNTVCGVADAGAHVGIICDASSPTSLLTHWGRDRSRGEKLSLEFWSASRLSTQRAHMGCLIAVL